MNASSLLPAHVQDLLNRCTQVFGSRWNAADAEALHEQIEAAAEQLEQSDGGRLAESLLELAVFLCSLVDLAAPPTPVSQARVAAMCAAMGSATIELSPHSVEAAANPSRPPMVILLNEAGCERLDLSAEIGRRKLLVMQVESLDALAAEVSRRPVACLVLFASWVDRAAEVVAAVERAHPHPLTQPGALAVVDVGDRVRRMFAFRAGVDQVSEASLATPLADEIAAFVRKRRHSAFRVLVVEDDRGQALFAQKVLGHRGMETLVATSAEEALALVDGFRPDLCLLDLNLPDRNGIELAQLLRERPGFELVQIVFLTGELSPDARNLAVRLGADDWIVKPVRPRDLLAVVESRAERARRSGSHDPVARLGRESARGVHSRRRLIESIANHIAGDPTEGSSVLLAVAPQVAPEAMSGVSWEQQAELGGEITRALRADGLVRSEVCQAETLCCLFIADPAAASLFALSAIVAGLDRRHWLAASGGIQLPFAVAGVSLDASLTPQRAVDAVTGLLRKAQQKAPHVRFQASASAAAQPAGWAQLRELFIGDALGRAHRIFFHPLMPVLGSRSGQFLLRAEFEVQLGDGGTAVPDHHAFARSSGMHLKLDQWLLSRCLDRLRLARSGLALMVEVCPESIEDPGFAAWLQSELQRRRMTTPELTLLIEADRMRGNSARAARVLQPYREMGLRIGLGPLSDAAADQELGCLEDVQLLVCSLASGSSELPAHILRVAAEYGKFVLVQGVDDPSAAGAMFRQPVHYLTGAAISPPLTRPEYEFPVD